MSRRHSTYFFSLFFLCKFIPFSDGTTRCLPPGLLLRFAILYVMQWIWCHCVRKYVFYILNLIWKQAMHVVHNLNYGWMNDITVVFIINYYDWNISNALSKILIVLLRRKWHLLMLVPVSREIIMVLFLCFFNFFFLKFFFWFYQPIRLLNFIKCCFVQINHNSIFTCPQRAKLNYNRTITFRIHGVLNLIQNDRGTIGGSESWPLEIIKSKVHWRTKHRRTFWIIDFFNKM